MSCRFKNLKKVSLSLLVISSMISSNLTIYNAKEFKTNNRQLTEAKYDRSEGNDVYLSFGGGEKAKITFLKNSVFRFNVEPDGVFKSAPEPMAPTHTTKIVDKDEDEYIDEYEEIHPNVKESDNQIIVSTNEVELLIDKDSAKMELKNSDGETVWKEKESLKYDGNKTIQTLDTKDDEYFYGGGMQNGYFSHKNRKIEIVNKSTWVNGGVASPTPFYFSTNGYGVLRHTFQPGEYDFHATATMEHQEDRFDAYYFVEDNSKEVLADFVELTGNPMFMPKYGFYQGNADCYNLDGETLLGEGIDRANQYNKNDMPVGWFLPNDGYGCGYGGLDNLKSFVDEVSKKGFRTGLWTEQDLDKLDSEVLSGTQMIKTDVAWVGEGYSFGLNAVRQAFEGIENNSDKRGFVVSLDGWAGTQRYAGLWSGDQTGGNWEYIRFHIPTYIGSGLSGNPNVGSDLDGIYGSNNIISTRDFQWKAFTPIMINMDGWTTGAEKNPWYHGEPYTSINRMYLKMKTAFMPYYYTYAKEAHDKGVPMVRAMMLEFPDDPYTWGNQTQYQYMWGENLLVAPVYNEADNNAEVRNKIYLPGGEDQVWIDYFTGEQYTGGKVINNFSAPLWKLPLLVKNGAILPKTVENNSQLEVIGNEDRIFEVYPSGNTEFEMYDDDGESQEYKDGKGATTLITSKAPKNGTGKAIITVDPTKGSFTGMKTERGTQFIVNVLEQPTAVNATINGKEIELRKVTTQEEYENATDNVYFYNEAPNLNHYATEGSEFASVEIITNPKVQVKIAKDDRDITKDTIKLTVEGFNNTQEHKVNESDPDLSDAQVPQLTAQSNDNSITLNWDSVEGQRYDLEIDGGADKEGMIYHNVSAPFVHESLNANEEHTYRLRLYNSKNESAWGPWQSFTTSEDRYKNVIKNTLGSASSQIGGYEASQAVDGDLSTLWYTDWNDPVANNSDKIYTIDLKQAYKLDKFEYYNDGTAQIKDHEIQVSRDGINYKTVEASYWQKPAEGTFNVFVDLNGEIARFVRIVSHDLRHNSANEFRVYKVDGTEGFSEADVSTDGQLGEPDLTFMKNYMGVKKDDDLATFNQAVTGDINYNNEIDAYDLMFVTSKLTNHESTGRKAAGEITLSTNKEVLKAGEEVEVSINANNLKDIDAFGLRLEVDSNIFEFNSTNPVIASKETANMHNFSRTLRGDKGLYVAFSNLEGESLQGNMPLATFKMKAKVDTNVILEPKNVIVVSSGYDVRNAFGFEQIPADIELLEDALFVAKALDTKIYSNESVTQFNNKIGEIQELLDNVNVTQIDIDNGFVSLVKALSQLDRVVQPSKEVLESLIETVTSKEVQENVETRELENLFINYVDKARNDLSSGSAEVIAKHIENVTNEFLKLNDKQGTTKYVENVYIEYATNLVSKLENIYTDNSLLELSEAINLNDIEKIKIAIFDLEKIKVLDINILSSLIEIADCIDETDFDDKDLLQLKEILSKAKELINASSAKQTDVDKMADKLSNEIIRLFNKTDKTALKIAVDLANAITDKDLEKVIPAVADEFKAARDEANAVYSDATVSQVEVNNAFDRLASAMQKLEFFKGDKTALKTFIDDVTGLDSTKYTEATWTSFNDALTAANGVYEDENAMQEEVNEAYTNLVTAFLNLRLIPDKSLLEELINQAEGLDSANYTKATFDGLTKALNEAKAVYENPNATQKEVDNAKATLEKAIAGLQVNSSTPSNVDNTVKTPVNNGDTTTSVKTGDNSLVGMFATIALLSVAGYVVLKRKDD